VAGTVQGDVVAVGGTISMTGNVRQDVTISGGSVNVTGSVGGDLRVFAGNVVIDGKIDGELLVLGGNVNITSNAVVLGAVDIRAGSVLVDPSAKLMSSKINIFAGEDEEKAAPKPIVEANVYLTTAFWISQLIFLLGIFVVVGVVYLISPNFAQRLVEDGVKNGQFWKSLLLGLMMLIVMPFMSLISLITVIGGFLAALISIAYLGLMLLSMLYSGVIFGGVVLQLINNSKELHLEMNWMWLIIGILGLYIVSFIPIIGWIISFVFFLVAWGAIVTMVWKRIRGV
jgi:cytoskeletal protein CcmA (bactofilin family)